MTQTLRAPSYFSHPPLRAEVRLPKSLRSVRIVRAALYQAANQLLRPGPQSVARILAALHAS